MVAPKGYKKTEIGIIPEDWAVALWGDVLNGFQSGATPYRAIKHYYDGTVKWVSSGELNYNFITDTLEHISEDAVKSTNLTIHDINTFLMAITGLEAEGTRGRCAILGCKATTNQSCLAITETKEIITKYLFYFYLMHGDELAFKYCQGTKQQSYTAKLVKLLPIYYPPVEEQKRIAEALTDTDELICNLEQLIAKKKDIKQGALQELLTGKKRLKGFDEDWKRYKISEMGNFYSGLTGKTKNDFGSGNANYISFLNVLSNIIIDTTMLEKVNVKENESQNNIAYGDLFFNTSSETPEEVGMCAVILSDEPNTYLNSFCFGFRLSNNKHNPLFLAHFFNETPGRTIMRLLAQGSTRYNLSKSNFSELIVELPTKEEQTAIATILSDMDAEISELEKKLAKYTDIKQGMMQELLTGRIRLPETDSAQEVMPKAKPKNANKHFEEVVVLSAMVALFSEKYPIGSFRRQKFAYLLHRHTKQKADGFAKKAAGPYNSNIRYKDEKIAIEKGYVVDTGNRKFTKGEKSEEAMDYFIKWYGEDAITWINQFKYRKSDDLELLTTVAEAVRELIDSDKEPTLLEVKKIIAGNSEWKPKLEKAFFNDNAIQSAIRESIKLFHQ